MKNLILLGLVTIAFLSCKRMIHTSILFRMEVLKPSAQAQLPSEWQLVGDGFLTIDNETKNGGQRCLKIHVDSGEVVIIVRSIFIKI